MAEKEPGVESAGGYVVLHEVESGHWVVLGEADRQPGLTARNSRIQAVRDALGSEPADGAVYAAVPRSEWRVARQL